MSENHLLIQILVLQSDSCARDDQVITTCCGLLSSAVILKDNRSCDSCDHNILFKQSLRGSKISSRISSDQKEWKHHNHDRIRRRHTPCCTSTHSGPCSGSSSSSPSLSSTFSTGPFRQPLSSWTSSSYATFPWAHFSHVSTTHNLLL